MSANSTTCPSASRPARADRFLPDPACPHARVEILISRAGIVRRGALESPASGDEPPGPAARTCLCFSGSADWSPVVYGDMNR
ncbi:unnamed protein product [Diplocarpon coronariae]|nr:hypothetical protein JHW43_008706 [Diplocarpon mali]